VAWWLLLYVVVTACRFVIAFVVLAATSALAREPGDPIRLDWSEGDVAGFSPIYAPDGGRAIGSIEYHQRRRGDLLEATRVARFTDGSSDEDQAVARVGKTLEALRGRSLLRDARGHTIVDLSIDVANGRLHGYYEDGGKRHEFDEAASLSPGTYWGPLVFIVLKNFAANAEGGRVRFQTVAPTPGPRVITMELVEGERSTLARPGANIDVGRYTLRPTVNWLVDPLLHRFVPATEFYLESGTPPALARFEGPRNYAGQEIRLE
jgi:hypothetical protein